MCLALASLLSLIISYDYDNHPSGWREERFYLTAISANLCTDFSNKGEILSKLEQQILDRYCQQDQRTFTKDVARKDSEGSHIEQYRKKIGKQDYKKSKSEIKEAKRAAEAKDNAPSKLKVLLGVEDIPSSPADFPIFNVLMTDSTSILVISGIGSFLRFISDKVVAENLFSDLLQVGFAFFAASFMIPGFINIHKPSINIASRINIDKNNNSDIGVKISNSYDLSQQSQNFTTSVFIKPIFSGLGLSYFSFCPPQFKLSTIQTLISHAYKIWVTSKSAPDNRERLKAPTMSMVHGTVEVMTLISSRRLATLRKANFTTMHKFPARGFL
ncbi:hypothetical protein GQR58_018124 [Nymphon striatum]|nr:hypothetical protein GQR58_018124 [Nymphon striatum]